MSRIIHFELPADNPETCIKFYEKVFGWQFKKWNASEDYWMIRTGDNDKPGINGGLIKKGNITSTVNTVQVTSLDESMRTVKANGGEIVMPKTSVQGVGYLAYFKDTEGNVLGMLQGDAAAK